MTIELLTAIVNYKCDILGGLEAGNRGIVI